MHRDKRRRIEEEVRYAVVFIRDEIFAEFTFKVWYWALYEETGCFLTSTHSCGACRVNKFK